MSMQSFKSFMEQIGQDSALRDELRSKAPEGMSIEQLASEAAARGFAFDASDVTTELAEADLDTVAGGLLPASISPFSKTIAPSSPGVIRGCDGSVMPSTFFKF